MQEFLCMAIMSDCVLVGMRINGWVSDLDLFDGIEEQRSWREDLCDGAVVLRAYAIASEADLLAGIDSVWRAAPFRHMHTPGGFRMSVAMTNCGDYGWVTDRTGYRYDAIDPLSGQPWPQMPAAFLALAQSAAAAAGTSRAGACPCIRIRTSKTTANPSSQCRWAYLRCSSSVATCAAINLCACPCNMVM
jgi:hypothetical protein